MADVRWFKIRSWHIYKLTTRGGALESVCGRFGDRDAPIIDDRPGNEKSCESCLRIAGPR